jgi:hypothetical protein
MGDVHRTVRIKGDRDLTDPVAALAHEGGESFHVGIASADGQGSTGNIAEVVLRVDDEQVVHVRSLEDLVGI